MNPMISIIVPFYNAERFLYDCINSIKAQTYQDFEVILVDDGSTDGSLQVLEKCIAGDSRFYIRHQENHGVSAARNVGIKYSKGDYLCFIDADDQVVSSYLIDLFQAIGPADSSMCGYKKIDMLSHEEYEIIPVRKTETLEESLLGFYSANFTDWQRYLWNRMFKKSIIEKYLLRFNENISYKEDGLFVIQYLCASNGLVSCVDKVLYEYYRNTTGAMSKTWHAFDPSIISNLEAHKLIKKELENKGVSDSILAKAEEQAKAACNWIHQIILQTNSFHLASLIRIERIMISILGFKKYFSWRTSQFFKLFR